MVTPKSKAKNRQKPEANLGQKRALFNPFPAVSPMPLPLASKGHQEAVGAPKLGPFSHAQTTNQTTQQPTNQTTKKEIEAMQLKPLEIIREAEILLYDLFQNPMSVILIDAPDPQHSGHKIRVVESRPPKWYMEIYDNHGGSGSFKRKKFIEALKNPFGETRYQKIAMELIARNLKVPF